MPTCPLLTRYALLSPTSHHVWQPAPILTMYVSLPSHPNHGRLPVPWLGVDGSSRPRLVLEVVVALLAAAEVLRDVTCSRGR